MPVKKAVKTSVKDEKVAVAEVNVPAVKVAKAKKVEEVVVEEEAPKKVKKSKKVEEIAEEVAPVVEEAPKKVKKSKKVEEVIEEVPPVVEEVVKKVKKTKKVEEVVEEVAPVVEEVVKKVKKTKKEEVVEEVAAPVVEVSKKRKTEEAAAPVVAKKVKVVEEEEKNPFEVTDKDVAGMTEDIKRECRIKTQYICLKLIGGRLGLKQFEKDLFLNDIKLDSFERAVSGLDKPEKAALTQAVMQLKYKELVRHLQVFTVRPHDNMDLKAIAEATKTVSGMCLKRRSIKYTKKYQGRLQEKKKRGEWDFTRVSEKTKNKNSNLDSNDRASIDKQKIRDARKEQPVTEVAKRLALAQEAAKARMKLASMADDE